MDRDGTKDGFDLELTRTISDAVPIPVIASGGVGTLEHGRDPPHWPTVAASAAVQGSKRTRIVARGSCMHSL